MELSHIRTGLRLLTQESSEVAINVTETAKEAGEKYKSKVTIFFGSLKESLQGTVGNKEGGTSCYCRRALDLPASAEENSE